jgi:hypothetical protein
MRGTLFAFSLAVSIHAPRCRGAMLNCFDAGEFKRFSFNPRPPLPGSDARLTRFAAAMCLSFNPRPPLPGSDADDRPNFFVRCLGLYRGFNPRPPLPGSDAHLP